MGIRTGKVCEKRWTKILNLPPSSAVVFDKRFTDYDRYQSLSDRSIIFITSLKHKTDRQNLVKQKGHKANDIAELYKEHWKIELNSRSIKQRLKEKMFLGTTPNTVLFLLWIALCLYLQLSYLKFRARLGTSLTKILRLLRLNLFFTRAPR